MARAGRSGRSDVELNRKRFLRRLRTASGERRFAARLAVLVHAEAELEFFELLGIALGGRVDVLGLGDELHVLATVEMAVDEDAFVRRELRAVDDQELVLVELHFLWDPRVEDRDAGAAVVDEQVFEIPEDAL